MHQSFRRASAAWQKFWLLICAFNLATLLYAGEPPITVVIDEAECAALGGWPLDRKWYAIALQNLARGGATRIFVDIAFPNSDFAHPESDEFFFQTLQSLSQVFLLARALSEDSITILGKRTFPAARAFLPFSEAFEVKGEKLLLKNFAARTLTTFFCTAPIEHALAIRLPSEKLVPQYTLRDAIQGNLQCQNRDVVLYLDCPGVSSYILSEATGQAFSTSELSLWAAQQIARGEALYVWEGWKWLLLLLLTLLPLLYYARKALSYDWAFLSIGLNVVIYAAMKLLKVDVPETWLFANLLPLLLIGAVVFVQYRQAVIRSVVKKAAEKAKAPTVRSNLFHHSHRC
ncbi:MAG: CHASE2 domain-containing protein [Chloroherpetonaceae bacterium]|nr:CHASE2 domain-containing protein [Chloroherpetonaceae bacterium]